MGALVSYLATLAKFGGPVLGLTGIMAWYIDQRQTDQHEAEQSQIDRLYNRIDELEQNQQEYRQELTTQHEKIVEQGREIAALREELAEAERLKMIKDAKIEQLQMRVERLQERVRRLADDSKLELDAVDPQEQQS